MAAPAPKLSAATMKAQAETVQLLSLHFDGDAGRYAAGWSDDKIAKDTGMAPDFVREMRLAAFGELREPEEVTRLRADIDALDQLAREQNSAIREAIHGLRAELARIAPAGVR